MLTEFGYFEFVLLGAVFDGFFAAGEGFADRLQAHALGGVGVQFLDFVICPSLAVAPKLFGHGSSFKADAH